MSGLKIGVGLDLAGLNADMSKVEQVGKRVAEALKGGKVGLNTREDKKALDNLVQQAEALADKLGEAGEQDILDVDSLSQGVKVLEAAVKAAGDLEKALGGKGGRTYGLGKVIDEFKLVEHHMRRVGRAQETLSRDSVRITQKELEEKKRLYDKWRQSGAFGTRPFRNVEFDEALAGGERQFGRSAWRRFQGASGLPIPRGESFLSSIGRTAGSGIVGSVLPGGVGTTVLHQAAREAAAEGGLLSGRGLAMLGTGAAVGGLAYGAVRAIQGVHASLGSAQSEAISLSDLRQSLGPLTTDFGLLRDSVHALADGFGVAHSEAAQLAREMAHTSGTVGEDLRTGIGFGRGYGIDPAQSTRFFAEMRHFGGARNEADNRRLAVFIAEAVNQGGTRHRLDEVLASISGFATLATRQALTAPNVGGYTSLLSTMTGLGFDGLRGDPGNAAAILAQADAAIRRGGNFGEASQNFTLGMLQREFKDISALDLNLVNEQSAFGTVAGAFGENSPAYRMAKAVGDQGALARYRHLTAGDDGRTNLARQLAGLEAQSGGNVDFFRKSVAGHLGLSESQAAALVTAFKEDPGLGRMEARLKEAGVDPRKMSMQSIGRLAQLMGTTDQAPLLAQRDKLLGMKLTDSERSELSGSGESLTNAILRLTAKYDAMDPGEAARKAQIDLTNEFQDFAKKLIPLATEVNEWVADIARSVSRIPGVGGSEFVKRIDAERAEKENQALDEFRRGKTSFSDISESEAGNPISRSRLGQANVAANELIHPETSPEKRRNLLREYRQALAKNPEDFPKGFGKFLDNIEERIRGTPEASRPVGSIGPGSIGDLPEPTIPDSVPPAGNRRYAGERRVSYLASRVLSPSRYDGLLREAASRYGVDWQDIKQLVAQESDFNPNADNGSDRGLMQLNRRYDAARGVTDPFDPRENIMIGAGVWAEALRAAGGNRWEAFRRYNGSGAAAEGYANNAMAVNRRWRGAADGFDAKVPAGRRREQHSSLGNRHSLAFSHQHNHVITIQDPRGVPLDATSVINTHVGPPIPAGMG
jgi:hypothetical protein